MVTTLDKKLKRRGHVGGADYTVALDAQGLRITGKGRRTPEVALLWQDLLSGDAALASALNASLAPHAHESPKRSPGKALPVARRPKRR